MSLFIGICTFVGFCFVMSFMFKVLGKTVCWFVSAIALGGMVLAVVCVFVLIACLLVV